MKTAKKSKGFKYLGKVFTPVRQLTSSESALGLRLPLRSIGINNYNGGQYNYDEFYSKAAKVGASTIDVFLMGNIEVVPCSNELFQLA